MQATHLVIGLGEVGNSLRDVLQCDGFDNAKPCPSVNETYEFVHICFPYFDGFEDQVKNYQQIFKPSVTVIHSTVPTGTSRACGAIHSPIHGIHPNLSQAIKTFVKYIGATERKDAERLLEEYSRFGIHGLIVKNPETSELSKLGCTTRHGLMLIEQKLFKKRCDEAGADFKEAYTMWNRFYGNGYEELGRPYIRRAIVEDKPGKIGGHCIISNCGLIGGAVADFILEQNEKL